MIRFIHAADFQIGKPYNWASDRAQRTLRERRETSIERVGEVADENDAQFIVVAGDFFDANTVGDDVITRACKRLSSIDVPVYILPGNHDFAAGPACVYQRSTFERHQPDQVTVLDDEVPEIVAGGEAVLLPAPIRRRNELGDPTSHYASDFGKDKAPDAVRISVAHEDLIDDLENTVLELRRRGDGVRPKASPDEIDAISTDGYVRTAVERLRGKAEEGEEAAEEALQLLYQLKQE